MNSENKIFGKHIRQFLQKNNHAWKFWPKIRPTFRGRAEDWVHVNQKKKMAAQREPNQVEILVALKEH